MVSEYEYKCSVFTWNGENVQKKWPLFTTWIILKYKTLIYIFRINNEIYFLQIGNIHKHQTR